MHSVKIILLAFIVTLSTAKGLAQYVQPMRYDHYSFTQQVNIGVGSARTTAASAYLEIGPATGATKGIIMPRVTTTLRDALVAPATGLVIYNTTTNRINYYNGTTWVDPTGTTYTFPYSVVAPGNAVQLENDTTGSPANYFYGRNSVGRRGWYPNSPIVTTLGVTKATYNSTTRVLNIPKDQRVGNYLNLGKTWLKQSPIVFGNSFVFTGNSWADGSYSLGTFWGTQLSNYYGKTKVTITGSGSELNHLVYNNWINARSTGSDSIAFVDVTFLPISNSATSGLPYAGSYWFGETTRNNAKTYNYIYGTYRAYMANYYLDTGWFSVASLADANFRDATAADSLGTKSTTGAIGLGDFSFTKPAGHTSLVIGTYGADSVRVRQGTIEVSVNGNTLYRRYFNGLNNSNMGLGSVIKRGLNYEAIVLQDLPDSATTVTVACHGDSTRFDYVGYLLPKEKAVRPLFINNIGYGSGRNYFVIPEDIIDTANQKLQDAVSDFAKYPIFIQNTNNWLDSSIHVQPSTFHLTAAGNDSVTKAYVANLIPQKYMPVRNISGGSGGGSTTPYVDTIYRTPGIDSIFWVKNGVTYKIKDSTGGGTPTLQQVLTAGSTLTTNNTIDGGGFSLSFDNVNKFKVGLSTTASGNYSTAFGFGTTASNSYSTAFGSSGTASGIYSTAMGLEGTASGHSSTVMGRYNKSKSFAGTVIGTFNDSTDATSPTSFNTANRAFEIGIGTADVARANAMTVLFNGNVGIGTTTPTSLLHVTGKSLFTDSLRYSLGATNGYVLTSDASGNATWQAASGGGATVGTYSTRIGLSPSNGDEFFQTDIGRDAPDGKYYYLNSKWHYQPIRPETLTTYWNEFQSITANQGYLSDGLIGWTGNSGTISFPSAPTLPGVAVFNTSTTTNGYAGFYGGAINNSGAWVMFDKGNCYFKTYINIPTLSDGTDTYSFRIGIGNGLLGDFSNGIYFEYSSATSANWLIKAANYTTRTTTTSSTAVTTGWHTLEILSNSNGTSVEYWVDGTSLGTITTNIPGSGNAQNPIMIMQKSAGTNSRRIEVDFIKAWQRLATQRD